ncbi:MAG: DinB family protein [Acidobacteria bacterium]|nr:DinB family protein [Acidobacteriota bacterium]
MTLQEFLLERLKAEVPVFLRVLKALPKDQLSYKPHDRSPSAEQLVWTITAEQKASLDVAIDHKAEWTNIPAPSMDEMLEKYEQWSNELIDRVSKLDETSWDLKAQFYYEGKLVFEQPVGLFLWNILFDAIHHRGQLSAYLRPMGGKVPAIYGPSADEPGTL